MIIDIHGHYTTAPAQLGAWRDLPIAYAERAGEAPDPAALRISEDDTRETIEANQLRLMDDRGSDVTVFSPRASFMAHHLGDLAVGETWARICNDLVARVSQLFPDRFLPGAMLPQSPGVDP
ncbi:amidohydrolase family protein, partial [Enterococcus faecium]|uniref:amidohydrolase family protein n=1 Tax=Enterococcus faecium TaxID=1352 RepID=UPI003F8A7EE0